MSVPAFKDWKSTYENIRSDFQVPDLTEVFDSDQTIIHRMFVRLSDLLEELKTKNTSPRKLAIFCDVLRIGKDKNNKILSIQSHLMVYARRIEVVGNTKALVSPEKSELVEMPGACDLQVDKVKGSLTIYTNEVDGTLQLDGPGFAVSSIKEFGFSARVKDNAWVRSDLQNLGLLREGSELAKSVLQSYQYSSILSDRQPSTAVPILQWIRRATGGWQGDMQQFYMQSHAMLCRAIQSTGTAKFVPWLAKEIYTKESQAFLAAVSKFEENYDAFHAANTNLKERAQYARVMLRNYQDLADVASRITKQLQSNLDEIDQSVAHYQDRVTDQQFIIDTARLRLQHGIRKYEAEKQREMAWEITNAVVSLGMAAGAAALGMPSMEAINTLKTADKAARATWAVARTIDSLGKVVEQLKKMAEAIKKIIAVSRRLDSFTGFESPVLEPSIYVLGETDDASWDIFRDEVSELVQPAIDKEIEGAVEYKLALTALTIYAKALNESQRNYVSVGQQLSTQLLNNTATLQQAQRMNQYITDLENDKGANDQMMQWILQRYLSVKRWLLLALQNHGDAYRYWALQEPAVSPNLNMKTAELTTAMAEIVRGESQALESFKPPPQDFSGHRITIKDPGTLAAFKSSRRLTLELGLDAKVFANKDRVRLGEISVWLEGLKPDTQVQILIGTTGSYRDRHRKRDFDFATAWPLELAFEYIAPNNIIMHGGIASEYRMSYFEPTPFTTWTIAVQGSDVSLEDVKSVTFEFMGNAITRK